MEIAFTKHAHFRMAQRNINEAEVIHTIERPDEVVDLGIYKKIFRKILIERNKTLEVVCKKEGKKMVIITAYWC